MSDTQVGHNFTAKVAAETAFPPLFLPKNNTVSTLLRLWGAQVLRETTKKNLKVSEGKKLVKAKSE